jgi:hypothetical protein
LVVDQRTGEKRSLFARDRISLGVHWSPDSHYVMAAEERSAAYDFMHGNLLGDKTRNMVIYRLQDGAFVSGDWFPGPGIGDYGYFWVRDWKTFVMNAGKPPAIRPCDSAEFLLWHTD